ncbi:MAG: precorrin-3B C(17)-methyltransferase, partial [Pseudomonadota bacterium]|nr:precorrin-3B C(17)-methyltransferase [Pseudomonadota bacterium]
QEQIKVVPLSAATADMADMHTVVLVGSSQTRLLSHKNRTFVYTPRAYED